MSRVSLLLVAAGVASADLMTKLLIVERLPIGSARPVIDGWFSIVHVRNPGPPSALARAWPVFNAADSATCVGIGVLLLASWRKPPAAREGVA